VSMAPAVRVCAVELFEAPYRLRLPFRFGVITVTEGVQAIVRVRLQLADGRQAWGYAAEALAAKWFDKNPLLSDEDNRHQLRRALELAREAYLATSPAPAFGFYAQNYHALLKAGAAEGLPPLAMSYGPALLDRAVMDALCRATGVGFAQAMQANLAGMAVPSDLTPDLLGFDMAAMLRGLSPQAFIHVRHTVGLLDPITGSDQAAGTRVNDGLPETLSEVIAAYGCSYFKIKVSGQIDADLDRLARIAHVLDRSQASYMVTLDGNEQYETAETITELWERVLAQPALQRFAKSTLLLEQPIKRQQALTEPVQTLARYLPVIVDESDGDLGAFVQARALGYTGVSTKSCKGFYKSLFNLARCQQWNAESMASGAPRFFMSAEDLTMQPGIAVQQDLALVSLMGMAHVERNAHHFIDGFDGRPDAEAHAFLAAHPDLYHVQNGRVRLRLEHGRLSLGSLQVPGFGSSVDCELDATSPMLAAAWPPPIAAAASAQGNRD
jgi:hypothetical protein